MLFQCWAGKSSERHEFLAMVFLYRTALPSDISVHRFSGTGQSAFSASAFDSSACQMACSACFALACTDFGTTVQYVHRLVHPVPLLNSATVNFLQCSPKSHGTIPDGQFRRIHPAGFQVSAAPRETSSASIPARRLQSPISRFSPRSFTPITTRAHQFRIHPPAGRL